MKIKMFLFLLTAFFLAVASLAPAQEPDRYIGDTAIYYSSGGPKPNVLFVLENSRYVANYVGGVDIYQYDPANPYSGALVKDSVYTTNNFVSYKYEFDLDEATESCDGVNPSELLETYGSYYGALDGNGNCIANPKKNDIQYYYLGDYVNYLKDEGAEAEEWQANTTYSKNDIVIPTDNNSLRYYATQEGDGTSGADEPDWPHLSDEDDLMSVVADGSVAWQRSETFLNLIISVFKASSAVMSENLKFGSMIFSGNNQGGQIWSEVLDLTEGSNLQDFQSDAEALSGVSLSSAALNPVNVMLYDALNYFEDGGAGHGEFWCQESHVILIANGGHRADQNLISVVGGTGTSAEVAAWGAQHGIKTHVVQLGAVDNVLQAAAENGGGEYHIAENFEDLDNSIKSILEGIVRESDTVFVAPVVPANPENQTYSGDYVYLGLFKPENTPPWSGNLKKFGLTEENGQLLIVDTDDNPVFGDGAADCTEEEDADGHPVMSQSCGLTSYWSANPDGSLVNFGGAGGKLLTDGPAGRNMLTLVGGSLEEFSFDNADFDTALLGLPEDVDAESMIRFVRGYNAFDEEAGVDDVRNWIMGDILHSRPLVVNYDKSDPDKTYIFVGTNGGMMHAFSDADGSESWAFIPPELLPKLQYLTDTEHAYYVDGSASIYIHDSDNNGVIGNDNNDLAVLVFGLRRGGGWQDLDYSEPHGAYYALDVTDPTDPQFLWKIDKNTDNFGELAQTWSQPQFAKVKTGEGDNIQTKVVAFVGAGYDNVEDLRYGSTDTYPDTRITGPTQDFSQGQSSGDVAASTAVVRGRGAYAIEIATIGSDSVNTTNTGTHLWSFVDTNNISHSVASDILVLDRNGDGFADRLYFGDMGGNLWRTNLSGNSWTTTKIFSSNPGQINGNNDNSTGRKLFYKLDASIVNSQSIMLYFGTGDRAHPLNHVSPGSNGAVVDRLYAVEDDDGYNYNAPLTEADLHDVTDNVLQQEQGAGESDDDYYARIETERASIQSAKGWYIRLDFNVGEKVTAAATVFNNVVYFTTYQPDPYGGADDPCSSSGFNLGTARLYAVNAKTGEAVFNFHEDSGTDQHGESQVAVDDEPTLRRADRQLDIGIGMPSGVVVVITEEGNAHLLIVVEQEGGGISQYAQEDDSWQRVRSLYWMQW